MPKVKAKSCYVFNPVMLDKIHTVSQAKPNQIVRVVNFPGAPKCNTMGQCHIETLDGQFLGMVATASLIPLDKPKRRKKNAITT